jgi:hypothetical protein
LIISCGLPLIIPKLHMTHKMLLTDWLGFLKQLY